jgi:DNA polymerase III gamma/tau subunit
MPLADQRDIYGSLVEDERNRLLGISKSMATDSGKDMGYKGYDPGFGGDTKAFNELVDSVDFPKFVADLLKAVFDANLKVMKQQTDSYIKLMKEATKSTADFIKKVKDDDTFAKLAESRSDKYNVTTEKQPDGSTKLALTNPEGEKADLEDAEVKRHVLEAKINMAKEHRAALREVLLMGVTRLVVNKGVIEASVDFSVKASRESKAHHDDQNINVTTVEQSYDSHSVDCSGGRAAVWR